ncbi:MAG: triose-phosphate isomerase [Burkholderiales bacterium]|nr:MAG: triose-phosphate isomerase [Burkholderiales bacterium]
MKVRKPLVAGNWKMNGDIVANEHLFTALRGALERASLGQVDVAVCPPYPYLGQAAAWLGDTGIAWGAQDVSAFPNGAYTGDVSASMLVDLGCRWSIVGHSERRQLAGETDDQVAAKVSMCVAHGVGVIACIGETLEEREAGATEVVLGRQVDAIVPALAGAAQPLSPERVVLAYEPVWAIGTGRTASPEMAQAAHRFVRERLAARGYRDAGAVRILYGGSVKPGIAVSLFAMPDVDGGLIGGASLVADDFLDICRAAAVA